MLMMLPGGHVGRSLGGLSTCPRGFSCRGREPMSVAVETLFTSALGLQPPWVVEDVKLDTANRRIDFEIGCQAKASSLKYSFSSRNRPKSAP